MSYESTPWSGASGSNYIFHIYERGEQIPSRLGIFIYCAKNDEGLWFPVYMGHGDLSICCDDAEISACIASKGATHVHMRLCANPEDRAEELADLLTFYGNAFVPYGCNSATGV